MRSLYEGLQQTEFYFSNYFLHSYQYFLHNNHFDFICSFHYCFFDVLHQLHLREVHTAKQ